MIYSHVMVRNTISQYLLASSSERDEILEFADDVVSSLTDELGEDGAYQKLNEIIPEIEDESGWYGNSLSSYRHVRGYMLQLVSC